MLVLASIWTCTSRGLGKAGIVRQIRKHHEKHGSRFDCVVNQEGTILTVVLGGDVDLATVQRIEGDLDFSLDGEERLVVLDLAAVEFIDSSGLRLLLRLKKAAEDHSARLLIGRLSQPVKRLLDLTKLSSRFEYLDGIEGAPIVCPLCERVLPIDADRCPHCGGVF